MKKNISPKQMSARVDNHPKTKSSRLAESIKTIATHDHLCLIYETKEEQFDAVVPFIQRGIESGEKCIYIADENTATDVLDAMRVGGIDVDAALKKGSLSVVTKKDAYLRNGYFDPDEMIQFLTDATAQAKKEGFSAFRVTGEMTWMLGDEPGSDRSIEYETKLNQFLPKNDCLALCQYNRNRFQSKILLDVIYTHPTVVVGNVVCRNFYYIPVDEFLRSKKEPGKEVDRLLRHLLDREHSEQEHRDDLKFMQSMDEINRAIQGATDLEQMMRDVLDKTLTIFDCDRAWLLYPSDPESPYFTIPMERTKPEYPGAHSFGAELPVDEQTIRVFKATKASNKPVIFDVESDPPIPTNITEQFHVQSQITINITPRVGKTYMFGLHQCSYRRVWTEEEKRLFQEISRRITSGLTSLLIQQDLQKSEEEYRRIVETTNEGIWVVDINHDGVITKINSQLQNMLGYTENELLGHKLSEFIVSEEQEDHKKQMQERLQGKRSFYERRFNRKDGTIIWARVSATPLLDDHKQVVGAFAMVTDITDRKQSEKELVRVNRMLYVLSDVNQALIKITTEQELLDEICRIIVEIGGYRLMWIGFAEYDAEKTVRPVAQAGFGIDYLNFAKITWADDARGQGPTGLAIRTGKTQVVHDIWTDPKMTPWRQAAVERGYKSSIALPLSSGGQTFGALNIYASEDDAFGQKEIGILEELADDLAFGLATMRLHKKIEERTKEVDQLKNKFIQIVSHQLRTPLTVIRWNLSAIIERERGEVAPPQMEALRSAYAANIEIISRIDDLLTAIEIEEGRFRLEQTDVNIQELMQSVSEEKLQPCLLKNISFEILSPKKPLPNISVDAVKIRDIIARLIDNAIAYSNEGGHIVVRFFLDKKKIRFEISDTGVGIPASEQPRIFERFHRGWNAALMRPDASGLSLYIAKHFIEAQQGSIGFSSVEKKGSTFWFELPVANEK